MAIRTTKCFPSPQPVVAADARHSDLQRPPLKLLVLIFLAVISGVILVVALNLVTKSVIQNDMRLLLIKMETKEFASLSVMEIKAGGSLSGDYYDLIKLQAKAIDGLVQTALNGGETVLGPLQPIQDENMRGDLKALSALLNRLRDVQSETAVADLAAMTRISNTLIQDITVVIKKDRKLLSAVQAGLISTVAALLLSALIAFRRYHRIIKLQNAHLQQQVALRTRDLEELLDKNKAQMHSLERANSRLVLFNSSISRLQEAGDLMALANNNVVLRQLVRDAMSLTGARYGAIALFDRDGQERNFIAEGLDAEVVERLGRLPRGGEPLGAVYHLIEAVRLDDVTQDPRFAGFPPGHPPMRSLLGVPLLVEGRSRGAIYLSEKTDGSDFSEDDEAVLHLYAIDLGHAIERADIYHELQDRNHRLEDKQTELEALIFQLKNAQAQLLQSEKMASIGQLAAGVAHEINNPVGYVSSNMNTLEGHIRDIFALLGAYEQAAVRLAEGDPRAEQLVRQREAIDVDFVKEDMQAILKECHEGITRVRKIVNDLKDFSHVSGSDWQWADVHKGLDSTLNIVHNEIKYKAEVIKHYGDLPEIDCMPHQLNQVFMNLLVNAAHAIEEHGTITVSTGCRGEEVWIEIADTGTGIKPEHVPHIFEPFFTTKPVGQGTGLGLAISYNIVKKHAGHLEVTSEPGRGTRFRILLPVRPPRDSSEQPTAERKVAS